MIGSRSSYRPNSKPFIGSPIPTKYQYSHSGAVKIEFLAGLVLLILAPIADKDIKMDKAYAKRLIAFAICFMLLFPLGSSPNPSVSRLGAALGGVLLLALFLLKPTKGFAVNFTTLVDTFVKALQPKAPGQGPA
jgi:hypothetical protein